MPATLARQLSDADNQGIRLTSASLTEPATPAEAFAVQRETLSLNNWLTGGYKVAIRPDGSSVSAPMASAILRYMAKYQASDMDRTFSALADPTRRHILLRLKDEPGLSVSELARPLSLKLPGMMKHLDVLSDAGLITRTKTGRTVSVNLSAGPMQEAMEWLRRYEGLWTVSLDRLVALVEEDAER
jgi:DNA-binding transcriptional ArsR family regulator